MISIHATLAGGDEFSSFWVDKRKGFLSTPPSRVRLAITSSAGSAVPIFLSTPPSRVATYYPKTTALPFMISIHATLAGGDSACSSSYR